MSPPLGGFMGSRRLGAAQSFHAPLEVCKIGIAQHRAEPLQGAVACRSTLDHPELVDDFELRVRELESVELLWFQRGQLGRQREEGRLSAALVSALVGAGDETRIVLISADRRLRPHDGS